MNNTRTAAYNMTPTAFEKKAFLVLSGLIVSLLVLYVYFVNQTVWNIVSRQDLTKSINTVSSQVATLEASYMSLSSSLTIDHAYDLGFKDITTTDTTFVDRPAAQTVAIR